MDKAKISATILLLITIAIVLSFNFDVTTVHDADQSILYVNESQTLSPTEQGITSSSLYALNNSYLEFDGVNDYVNTGTTLSSLNQTNSTISVWLYFKQNVSATTNIISCGTTTDTIGIRLADYTSSINITAYAVNSTGLTKTAIPPFTMLRNQYYLFTSVFNGTNLLFYVNGNLVGISQNTGTLRNINLCRIGTGISTNTNYFKGMLDEVRIYNRSLEESEITEIYNSGRYKNLSLPSDGLVLYMPFEETNGTTIYDNSGNNNNGELIYE